MVRGGCLNGELDTSIYATPMPFIGLYTTIGTLVCCLLMAIDVWCGFHRRKSWLPCKLFSLNSFTLSIVAVATKLPMDLSTSMPRGVDQLSKLTGTVMLCISMGFFMPSLGTMRMSECISNLAALTVLVITVIVNVSIQIYTGVIYAFIVEHAIIMFSMLVVLLLLWYSCLANIYQKFSFKRYFKIVQHKDESKWCLETMREKLQNLCAYSYVYNPQFYCCQTPIYSIVGVLCSLATTLVFKAAVRSFYTGKLRFCNGVSDYKWSMWWIVVTQFVTIILGSFTILFRWLTVVGHMSIERFGSWKNVFEVQWFWKYSFLVIHVHPLPFEFPSSSLMNSFLEAKQVALNVFMSMQNGFIVMGQLVVFLSLMVKKSCAFGISLFKSKHHVEMGGRPSAETDFKGFQFPNETCAGLHGWILGLIVDDVRRWKEINGRNVPTDLIQLLSRNFSPSPEPKSILSSIKNIGSKYYQEKCNSIINYRVSCLSVVVFATIARISLPTPLYDSLSRSINEAIDIIFFVDKKMSGQDVSDKWKVLAAKFVWDCRNMSSHWTNKAIISPVLKRVGKPDKKSAVGVGQVKGEKDDVVEVIKELSRLQMTVMSVGPLKYVVPEFAIISKSILSTGLTSIPQLFACMEKTFVEMVRAFLADLPRAIIMECSKSCIEDLEPRFGNAVKFFSKLELLGDKILWSWPTENETASRENPLLQGGTQANIKGNNSSGTGTARIGAEEESVGSIVVETQGDKMTEEIELEEIVTNDGYGIWQTHGGSD